VTGLSMLSTELSGKRLELLKDIVPTLGRVAVLRNPEFPAVAIQSKETAAAAKSLGLQLQAFEVKNPGRRRRRVLVHDQSTNEGAYRVQ